MADYRGGEMRMSEYGAQAVKAIREGRTESQRRRDFARKLAVTMTQAGLMGAAVAAKGAHSKEEAAKHKQKMGDNALMASTEKYRAPDYTGPEGEVPDWVGARGSDGNRDALQPSEPSAAPDWAHQPKSLEERASEALAGRPAPKPTVDPLIKAQQEEEAHRSLARRQTGINPMGGGMLGSLPRRSR